MRYKIDLHTHSIISYDGGIKREQYAYLLKNGILDVIAITDHNETGFAREMAKEFGKKIIVGEEITTKDGEMIGLFLQKTIPPKLNPKETTKQIHDQGGIVYIPHPFEIFRKGLKNSALQSIIQDIDLVEVFNARAKWRGRSEQALAFAQKYGISSASSSDSHCFEGMGSSFSIISEIPTPKTLVKLLSKGELRKKFAPPLTYFYPAINKIKHAFYV